MLAKCYINILLIYRYIITYIYLYIIKLINNINIFDHIWYVITCPWMFLTEE